MQSINFKGSDGKEYSVPLTFTNGEKISIEQMENYKRLTKTLERAEADINNLDHWFEFTDALFSFLSYDFAKAYPDHPISKDYIDPLLGLTEKGKVIFAKFIGDKEGLESIAKQFQESDLGKEDGNTKKSVRKNNKQSSEQDSRTN